MRTEDGYIIRKCLNGEAAAFGLLVDKYKESVYALAYSKLGNFHDAEDVTQEAFIKAFQKLRTLRWWDNFMAWIYAITSNLCKDWIRARSRRPDREFAEDQDPRALCHPSMESYRESLVFESLHEALDSLPETYRQVLVLHYLGGMKIREIARFPGTSPSTIARRLRKARSQLKGEMLATISTTFDQQKLRPGFTFFVVETVKRATIQPAPRMSRLPLGLSAATAIVLTLLSFTPRLLPLNRVGALMGLVNPSQTELIDTDGVYTDMVKTSEPAEQIIPIESVQVIPKVNAASVMRTSRITPTRVLEFNDVRIRHNVRADFNAPDERTLPEGLTYADIPRGRSQGSPLRIVSPMSIAASGAPTIGRGMVGTQDGVARDGIGVQGLSIIKNATAAAQDVNAKLIGRLGIGNVNSIAWSPDGRLLAVGTVTGVYIISPGTLDILNFMEEHSDSISSVSFSPDGSMIASGSRDNTIKLWSASSGKYIATLIGHRGEVNSVAFSPDGSIIASASWGFPVKLWRVSDGECIATLKHGWWSATSITFSPVPAYAGISTIASGAMDGVIKLWEVPDDSRSATLGGHRGSVYSVALSPDGSFLASGGSDSVIKLWSMWDGKCVATLLGHNDIVNSVAISPDGSMIASGSDDKTIKLWSALNGELMAALEGHNGSVNSISFSPDSSMIASGGDDRTIKLWSVPDRKCIATLKGHRDIGWSGIKGDVLSVAFSPDGSMIASGSDDKTIKLWSVSDGECVATLKGHQGYVHSVAFGPGGSVIASGSDDRTVKLWKVPDGACAATLEGHNGAIGSVIFSLDGSFIVSGSDDRTVRLWKVSDGKCVATLERHRGEVHSIAFSPDSSLIASGSGDGTIGLWEVMSNQ